MKKIILIIFMSLFIVSATPYKARAALGIDFTAIASEITKYVDKIQEATNFVQNASQKIKEIDISGFDFMSLLENYVDFNKLLSSVSANEDGVAKGTKQKSLELINALQAGNVEAINKMYEEQIKQTQENIRKLNEAEIQNDSEISRKKTEVNRLYNILRNKETTGAPLFEVQMARNDYNKAKSELEELEAKAEGIKAYKKTEEDNKTSIEEAKSKVGTEEDALYQSYEKQKKLTENTEEKAKMITPDDSSDDGIWGGENDATNNFNLGEEDYKEFIETYFYDPEEITRTIGSSSGYEASASIQSVQERVTRERKFLLINTAIHLLQVSATIKREIPERASTVKEYFDDVVSTEDELQAKTSYARTRIENARALLLYARLQTAKLQYFSAKEINSLDRVKLGKKGYGPVDLKNYKIDNNTIKERIEEMKKGEADLHAGMEGGYHE